MKVHFFSSGFCQPCAATRDVLAEVARLVPVASIEEFDVAMRSDAAEAAQIVSTPTVVIYSHADGEVFRARGIPTVDQVLVALAQAV